MGQNIKRLVLNEREFILIGTAHISQESINEVKQYIEDEKPDCVAIELDDGRYESLKNPDSWQNLDIVKVLKEKRGWVLLANLVLGSFQKRMGADVGVKPGEEMKAAADKCEELGIKTAMVDRPIQTTLRRAWAKNTFWGKCKLLGVLFSSLFEDEDISSEDIEKLKNTNEMDQMMGELANYLPGVKTVLIDERDQYLASGIWKTEGKKVIAVLGAGHLPGVEKHLNAFAASTETPDTEEISQVPPPSLLSKIIGWAIPVAIVALIAASAVKGGASAAFDQFLYWWLINGTLSALGALIALAHPITVIVCFMGAWLTSLCPLIGIGIVAGIVQALVYKPKVGDLQNINTDVSSLKGWYKNRLLRVLLVFLLSSVGSSIGTFAAFPALISFLAK
ncbi:MAG: TraB/GumN family protein [Spirochaetaceae bacterium]|nr:TraB/GumN family protein [Spirochaetaceae bacterium]MBR4823405.1 TraB/GumN family protein [Spirochaetaceae bacterium]